MALLTDEELLETLETQLPALLKRHPEMEQRIYRAFMRTLHPEQKVEGAIVTMAPLNQVEARCVEWDIALVR